MSEQKFKASRYYEGLCSTSEFIKELAKVLSMGVKSEAVKDTDGNILIDPFILQSRNWDIVYPLPDKSILNIDYANMTSDEYKAKIENQINQISDTVILKTVTTPQDISEQLDDLSISEDSQKDSLTMYLELYKPAFLADPEIYTLDCERDGVTPKLITKDMYKDSYAETKRIEEVITLETNTSVCEMTNASSKDTKSITYSVENEISLITTKIQNIYGTNAGAEDFYCPSEAGTSSAVIEFNSSKLAELKQKDNDLYVLIKDTFNLDDRTYQKLSTLTFQITKNTNASYTMTMVATTKYIMYKIPAGRSYTLKNIGSSELLSSVVPEYKIEGIYVPLPQTSFSVSGSTITFTTVIEGDVNQNGNIVIRYDIKKSPQTTITDRKAISNNHYILMRLFDNVNESGNAPMEDSYDNNGELVLKRSHVSDWSKLSWYQDFEDIYIDEIDVDSNTGDINDGTIHVPLETVGLNSDTKIRYWINSNNDRFSMVVMGNPSLDYSRDRHITGICYCGKIDSFDNSVNDVAGNFALFTSASTEPCDTIMNTQKTPNSISATDKVNAFSLACVAGTVEYHVVLPEGRHFNKNVWPKYCIADENGDLTEERTVYQIYYENDQEAVISIHQAYNSSYTLYIGYLYYEEDVMFTSGVERDVFGNVLNVAKTKTYGLNTSDGVTSIMMYHTQSKAYYQKHHMMFTTTEEYMSKVMYGKSSYTGEYYADRIKVTHTNDGPRGMLNDLLIIDSSSLYPLDELVINKDFEKNKEEYEETYVYFPVTAPFSPLSDSPNARYGVAIKKNEVEPTYSDEQKVVSIALDQLQMISDETWWGIDKNIYPLSKTANGSTVLWEVVKDSSWVEEPTHLTTREPIHLAMLQTKEFRGIKVVDGVDVFTALTKQAAVLAPGDTVSSLTKSFVKLTGFTLGAGEKLYYGISDVVINNINDEAYIKYVPLKNGTPVLNSYNENYVYGIQGVPYSNVIENANFSDGMQIELSNATPNKYLVLYSVKELDHQGLIKGFACVPLTKDGSANTNDLLQYPCTVRTIVIGGIGNLITPDTILADYNSDVTIAFTGVDTWTADKILVNAVETPITQVTVNGLQYQGCVITGIKADTKVELVFK